MSSIKSPLGFSTLSPAGAGPPALAVSIITALLVAVSASHAQSTEHPDHAKADPSDSRPAQARVEQQRRLIQEGVRASRSARPPAGVAPQPFFTPASNNGIAQLPVEAGTQGFSKEDSSPAPDTQSRERQPPAAARAQPWLPGPLPPPCFGHTRTASLVKVFPEVSWHVCVRDAGRKSLWVGPVHMKRSPSGPWMTIIAEAGLAEIFVPYHQINFRPYDLQWGQAGGLLQVGPQDIGSAGSLIWLSGEPIPTVVAEVRDRGIGWLCKQVTAPTRRAQELVIWGIADGGNYDNIVEYGFRDDGAITFRTGNTGFNSPADPVEPHTHVALWRLDTDLNGAGGDSAYWLTHGEPAAPVPPPYAQDARTAFNVEGARQWNGLQYTSLLIEDAATNAFGQNLGYEFTPLQTALSRHFGPRDSWTQNDVYVTRYSADERSWMGPQDFPNAPFRAPDEYLLTYLDGQSVTNQDLVVWVKTAAHHTPGAEDKSAADLNTGQTTGVTLTHWSGFQMEPHNLFNSNPLGGPARCWP